MADAALFVIGASGAGKTAAVKWLQTESGFRGACRFFDSIGVPTVEEMIEEFGSPDGWQEAATDGWVRALVDDPAELVVLEGQTRTGFIRAAAERHGLRRWTIVLMECSSDVRRRRLGMRGQPGLASEDMERWAAYLRGQADALGLPVIDTSELTVAEAGAELEAHVRRLCPDCFATGEGD